MEQVIKKREQIDERFLETFLILATKVQEMEKKHRTDRILQDEKLKSSEKTKRLAGIKKWDEEIKNKRKDARQILDYLSSIDNYKKEIVDLRELRKIMHEATATNGYKIVHSKLRKTDNKKFEVIEQARKKAEKLSSIKSGYYIKKKRG